MKNRQNRVKLHCRHDENEEETELISTFRPSSLKNEGKINKKGNARVHSSQTNLNSKKIIITSN